MLSKKPARERPWSTRHDFSSKATTGNKKWNDAARMREANIFPSVILSLFSEEEKRKTTWLPLPRRINLYLIARNEEIYMLYFTRINNMTMTKSFAFNNKSYIK